ncbi:MAG: TerC family protein [Salinarimonas sp.]
MELSFLLAEFLGKPAWLWLAFIGVVGLILAFDLGVLHKKAHEIELRESILLSLFYIGLGLTYGGFVWWYLGPDSGMQYLTGYAVEKSLSMDNVFVIGVILAYFGIPRAYQHRILFWGILGVIVLRGIMIGLGAGLVAQFHWILYIFAAFLIFTGIKMLMSAGGDDHYDVEKNAVLKYMRKRFHVTDKVDEDRFWRKLPDAKTGRLAWHATPLFLALVCVELADVIFAVDSIPAIFTITTDPFIVFTSNIFAILGLRAMFFMLSALVHRFEYLKYALSAVLVFIGSKIFVADLMGWEKFPPPVSLGVTFGLLAAGFLFSLWKTRTAPEPMPVPIPVPVTVETPPVERIG